MVTKHSFMFTSYFLGLILAKIHMVTKLFKDEELDRFRLILAKIHMVTKRFFVYV